MHRFFVPTPFAEKMQIVGMDAHHICKVLRMQSGQHLQLVSSDGVTALMEIESVTASAAFVRFVSYLASSSEPAVKLVLAQGLAKGEKMDFVVQKAVEIGVSRIIPLALEYSVVQLDAAKAEKKVARWQKIAAEAAKQCKRDLVPLVEPVINLRELLAKEHATLRLLASESEQQVGLKQVLQSGGKTDEILLIVGPEGGIAPAELKLAEDSGVYAISLGKRILRTETAGLVAAAAIFYETGDLGG
ncbi:MAG: 16S rRNA (uracil(1498)-N(3))-methyltransferase [Acidaminococcaceae bacterium]